MVVQWEKGLIYPKLKDPSDVTAYTMKFKGLSRFGNIATATVESDGLNITNILVSGEHVTFIAANGVAPSLQEVTVTVTPDQSVVPYALTKQRSFCIKVDQL